MTVTSLPVAGVLAVGSYVPVTAVARRGGAVPVPNGDEDIVTMAIEAGLTCLQSRDAAGSGYEVDELVLVTSGDSPAVATAAEIVREALGLPPDVRAALAAGDRQGGVWALLAALDAVAAGRVGRVLVLAVELGDGAQISAAAVGLIIGSATAPLVRVGHIRTEGAVVFDRWTDSAGASEVNEPRYLQHGVARGLGAVLARFSAPRPLFLTGARPSVVAESGAAAVVESVRAVRDAGVAGPLLALVVGAREAVGDYAVVAANGRRVTVLDCASSPEVSGSIPDPGLDRIVAVAPVDQPVSPLLSLPTSSPFFERSAREMLRLEGARCIACGHVVFPPSQRPVCARCHGVDFVVQPLSRRGTVHTYTVNRFLPVGFGKQMTLVLADLDDGNRYFAPTTGPASATVAIGTRVRLGVRRFSDAGGVPVYAMKFFADDRAGDVGDTAMTGAL